MLYDSSPPTRTLGASAEEENPPPPQVQRAGPEFEGNELPVSLGFTLRLAGIGPGTGWDVRRPVFWFQLSH